MVYFEVLKKYATFSGRARRKEYWMFMLWNFVVAFVLGFVDGLMGWTFGDNNGYMSTVYQFAVLVPSIALCWRRMHDVNKAGPFSFIPFYSLYLSLKSGDVGENRFGSDPKVV